MRAARYYGRQDVRVDTVEPPTPDTGEVLIDIRACGICGSDLGMYLHGPQAGSKHLPITLGHELGGTIATVGDSVDVAVGTEIVLNPLVACEECWCCDEGKYNLCRNLTVVGAQRPGGYAEQVAAPAKNVIPLPEGISPEIAAVSEPFAVAFHALRESPFRPGNSVGVVGMGPIGLGLVQLAKAAGAGPIYASGHRDARLALATECGADVVIDPRETDPIDRVSQDLDGGVDVAFEVAGNEGALNDAIGIARPDGNSTIVGVFEGDVSIDPMTLVNHQRSVEASAAYQTGPLADRDFEPILRQFEAGEVDPEPLVTSRIGLEQIVHDGFEALSDDEAGEVKVLVTP